MAICHTEPAPWKPMGARTTPNHPRNHVSKSILLQTIITIANLYLPFFTIMHHSWYVPPFCNDGSQTSCRLPAHFALCYWFDSIDIVTLLHCTHLSFIIMLLAMSSACVLMSWWASCWCIPRLENQGPSQIIYFDDVKSQIKILALFDAKKCQL